MIHDIINNVYKKDEDSEDHIYENTKTNKLVYENIDFSSNGRSSNETVNPTMILVSDDGEWHSCDYDLYLFTTGNVKFVRDCDAWYFL